MLRVLAQSGSWSYWPAYVLAGLMILYTVLMPWLRRRKDPLADPPRFSLAREREVEKQMQNLLVELSEMARQVTAQLDTRAAKLQALIDTADAKIDELRRLEKMRNLENHDPANPRPDAAAAPAERDERHEQVYRLADEGRTANEIARQLGRPNGEIELILALRPR